MKILAKLATLVTPLSIVLAAGSASAEEFIPIGDGYECVRFINGTSYLINHHVGEDYDLVDSKAWKDALAKELRKIADRQEQLNNIAPEYTKKNPDKSDVKTFKKYFKAYGFSLTGLNIVEIDTQPERKAVVASMRRGLKDRKNSVKTYLARIKDCTSGQLKLPRGGSYIYPRAQLVGFKATNNTESYGGYILIDKARKPTKNSQPTGFNGCLKVYWRDGSVGGLYTGMGDEPCFGRAGAFQYATQQCNATVGNGEVGYPLQKAVGIGVSDETLAQVVELARQDPPQAIFLVLPYDMSRDKSLALCDQFLNR